MAARGGQRQTPFQLLAPSSQKPEGTAPLGGLCRDGKAYRSHCRDQKTAEKKPQGPLGWQSWYVKMLWTFRWF